jgi:hypothetical protein
MAGWAKRCTGWPLSSASSGVDVDHAVAPALGGVGAPGVQLVVIHQHQRARTGQVLAAAVRALHAPLDRADAEGVGMRREGVVDDLGAVQLDAGAVRHTPDSARSRGESKASGTPLGRGSEHMVAHGSGARRQSRP